MNNKNIYVVLQVDFLNDSQDIGVDVLEVFTTEEKAQKYIDKEIRNNIENFNFIQDEEDKSRIFCGYQENWSNYIEFHIVKKEVL